MASYFAFESPIRAFCCQLINRYFLKGEIVPDTLVSRIISLPNVSLINSFFNRIRIPSIPDDELDNGLLDTMRYLVHHDNFIKPYGEEHILLCLLTRCFQNPYMSIGKLFQYLNILTPLQLILYNMFWFYCGIVLHNCYALCKVFIVYDCIAFCSVSPFLGFLRK